MSEHKRLPVHDTMDLSKVPRRQEVPSDTNNGTVTAQNNTFGQPGSTPTTTDNTTKTTTPPTNGVQIRQITRFGNRAKTPTLTLNKPLTPEQIQQNNEQNQQNNESNDPKIANDQNPITTSIAPTSAVGSPLNTTHFRSHSQVNEDNSQLDSSASSHTTFNTFSSPLDNSYMSQNDSFNNPSAFHSVNNSTVFSQGSNDQSFDNLIEKFQNKTKDFELERAELDLRNEAQKNAVAEFGNSIKQQRNEIGVFAEGFKVFLNSAQDCLENLQNLSQKAQLSPDLMDFFNVATQSLMDMRANTDMAIAKQRAKKSTNESNLVLNRSNGLPNGTFGDFSFDTTNTFSSLNPGHNSFGNNDDDDDTIVTPVKQLVTNTNVVLNTKHLDTSGDISFDLNDVGGTGFSPNKFRQANNVNSIQNPQNAQNGSNPFQNSPNPLNVPQSALETQPPQQQLPVQPRRQIQNRFRDSFAIGKSKPEGPSFPIAPEKVENDPKETQTAISQQDLAQKFKDDDDFEDDDCFVKKPATTPVLTREELVQKFKEDNDFEDDDCFVKKPSDPLPKIPTDQVAKVAVLTQEQLAQKFKDDDDFEDDECFVKKPVQPTITNLKQLVLTQEQLAQKFKEDDDFEDDECFVKKPPTPSAKVYHRLQEEQEQEALRNQQIQQDLARQFAADDDFEDDDCFIAKPLQKTQSQQQQDLAQKFKEDDDFEDDDCFVQKAIPLPPAPDPSDDFEDDSCVVQYYNNGPKSMFSDVFASYVQPNIDDLFAISSHLDVPFDVQQQLIPFSTDDEDYYDDEDDHDQSNSNPTSQLAPGMNALSFMRGDDDDEDDDSDDDDESQNQKRTLTFPSAEAKQTAKLNQAKSNPQQRRVHFTAPASTRPVLTLRVQQYQPQNYEGYEFIRDYDHQKDGEIEPIVLENDTYNSLDDIDNQATSDSTLFYQSATRKNTESNSTPTLSPHQANRDWGCFPRSRLSDQDEGHFDYEEDDEDDDGYYSGSLDSSYGYGSYQGSYDIPPPLPDEGDIDPLAHQAKLMALLYGTKTPETTTTTDSTPATEPAEQSEGHSLFDSSSDIFGGAQ